MSETQQPGWEHKVIEKLAFESLREARRRRRWTIFFRVLAFAYVGFILYMVWGGRSSDGTALAEGSERAALVSLEGTIAAGEKASAENINAALRAAFEAKSTKGVILRINSPGGSPVQAGMINDEITRLRKKFPGKPIYAVVEDVCASGGYYVAAAANRIFVDKGSIVGSIGVRMDGFGFTGAMEKLGVERRSITAGENKAFLDPFLPQNPKQLDYARSMLAEVHQQFIDVVRAGRGARLKDKDHPELFSGLIWSGARSIELGLADGLGSVDSVAREVIQTDKIENYTRSDNVAERLAKRFGADLASGVSESLGGVSWR